MQTPDARQTMPFNQAILSNIQFISTILIFLISIFVQTQRNHMNFDAIPYETDRILSSNI